MARTENITIKYLTVLRDGLNESNTAGKVYWDGEDKPFVVRLNKETVTEVFDGRGQVHADTTIEREAIADMSLEAAAKLAASLISDITYAAEVAERRVLIPEPKEA